MQCFAICTLCLSLVGYGQGQQGVMIDKIIARVDNHYILNSELEEMYNSYTAERPESSGKMPDS